MHLKKQKTPDLHNRYQHFTQDKDDNCLNWINYQAVNTTFSPWSDCYIAKPHHPDQKSCVHKGLPIGDPSAIELYNVLLIFIQSNSNNKLKIKK